MTGAPRIDGYDWAGGHEAMLRFGPDDGPVVVVALPLFEEANRTRAFAVGICRALAVRGVASILPDLPGQGESPVATETATLDMIFAGYLAVLHILEREDRTPYAASIRSGAIIDVVGVIPFRWHLSPSDGAELTRDLLRVRQAGSYPTSAAPSAGALIEVAGNSIQPSFMQALEKAGKITPRDGLPLRTVRLSTDPAPADRKIDGAPLWRRSEPGTDAGLSQVLADDIADWIAACEG